MYDGHMMAKIELPDTMKNEVCGICGNYDGVYGNDQQLGRMFIGSTFNPDECNALKVQGPYLRQVCLTC